MGYFDAFMDTGRAVARSILGDSYGQGLKFDADAVAKSAAYNKIGGVARDVLNVGVSTNAIDRETANKIRISIKEGSEKAISDVNTLAGKMGASSDEAAKAVAGRFGDTMAGYEKAKAADTAASYAEFLGKEAGGGIGIKNTVSGYFFDAKHGNERIKTAAIAGAGIAVTGRVLSGGTLTHKNTGERDIAGIPFI